MRDTKEIIATFMSILNWASERGKYTKSFGIKESLHMAEIHAIELIGENPELIMAELCDKLGVTKGRVSKLVANMEKKGAVEKTRAANNKKEIILGLTPKGQAALMYHKNKESQLLKEINDILDVLTEEDIRKFNAVLLEVRKALWDYN